jgi:hypothetical protein
MACPVCGADICACGRTLADAFISGGDPDPTEAPVYVDYTPPPPADNDDGDKKGSY